MVIFKYAICTSFGSNSANQKIPCNIVFFLLIEVLCLQVSEKMQQNYQEMTKLMNALAHKFQKNWTYFRWIVKNYIIFYFLIPNLSTLRTSRHKMHEMTYNWPKIDRIYECLDTWVTGTLNLLSMYRKKW